MNNATSGPTARLIFRDAAWSFPGGTCGLQIWRVRHQGYVLDVAILTEDAFASGVSVTNAIEIIAGRVESQTDGTLDAIVQHTAGAFGDTSWVGFTASGAPRWKPTTLTEVAAKIGIDRSDLLFV